MGVRESAGADTGKLAREDELQRSEGLKTPRIQMRKR
jgi:hypothetical protein